MNKRERLALLAGLRASKALSLWPCKRRGNRPAGRVRAWVQRLGLRLGLGLLPAAVWLTRPLWSGLVFKFSALSSGAWGEACTVTPTAQPEGTRNLRLQ